jgi:hypothetical protein
MSRSEHAWMSCQRNIIPHSGGICQHILLMILFVWLYRFQFYVMNIFDNILINNLCITLLFRTLFCVFCRTLQAMDIDEYIKDLIAFLGKVSEENMGYWTQYMLIKI